LERSPYLETVRRIVVKIGTRVLTDEEGCLATAVFDSIVDQVIHLSEKGKEMVLVSSGAIAAGRTLLTPTHRDASIPEKQALAAVGQTQLMGMYQQALDRHGKRAAQVLLTRDDLSHRRRYLNARNTLFKLLQFSVIPIVNENDTVMVEEIKFGDNDSLSARVTILADADLLILLTDTPGLCAWEKRGEPEEAPVPFVKEVTQELQAWAKGPSDPLGTGGMATKIEAARIATQAGHPAVIADGRRPGVIPAILAGEPIGTFFAPVKDRLTHKKHWIAYSLRKKGELILDDGAVQAIVHKGKSLLPSGVVKVSGRFDTGEMVACLDGNGTERARGITNYSSQEVRKIAGKKSSEIEALLGYRIRDEIIHRDELVVVTKKGSGVRDQGSGAAHKPKRSR
jgi:glutamate 5-kinase